MDVLQPDEYEPCINDSRSAVVLQDARSNAEGRAALSSVLQQNLEACRESLLWSGMGIGTHEGNTWW